ncbi:methyltransferase-like protein 4 isoform X3 [Hippocampus comes]|uniref:methyltransferase-like protein 4 isoform X3 n=1 Tax=Hippocampus comes TaxID=109280 RepID=UPI00094E1357|nr:PREDICTED: methyltransferase-like protein 4 isoform X3 [Hippocampus comes]
MSVVVENTHGWLLDACSLIDQDYVRCFRLQDELKSEFVARFKRQYFRILKSYGDGKNNKISNHNVQAVKQDVLQSQERPPKCLFQKRKRSELNQGEIDSKAFHEKMRCVILEGTKSLVESATLLGYLHGRSDSVKDTESCAQCNLASLCDMAKELPLVDDEDQERCVQSLDASDGTSHLDLFSRVTENPAEHAAVTMLMGEDYVIPPRTAFLLSDFSRMEPLLRYGHKFDVIVVDPPWENKSVKRSQRYTCLPSSQLKRLDIPRLASPDSLVVTWVTADGEFVFPLDSPHKKPYEVLILGRYRGHSRLSPSERCAGAGTPTVQDQRLIVSIPSALHSHKPSLAEVLKPYMKVGGECLELFARSLQAGWTSWGNEVLRFQHSSYFTLTPAGQPLATGSCLPPNF